MGPQSGGPALFTQKAMLFNTSYDMQPYSRVDYSLILHTTYTTPLNNHSTITTDMLAAITRYVVLNTNRAYAIFFIAYVYGWSCAVFLLGRDALG